MNNSKIIRKLKKLQHVVSKETGVNCTNEPTKKLAVCNAGLVNGLTEEILIKHFTKYGSVDRIILLPEKSCCFLSYYKLESAIEAHTAASGKLNIAQDNKPIYLSYIEDFPEIVHRKIYNELPPGVILLKDFINETEEEILLATQDDFPQGMKNRQVKHYGFEFRYDNNNVDKDKPLKENIPNECNFLWSRLKDQYYIDFQPDQLTVNCYNAGQGIPSHVDTHSAFEDPILSLSLGSTVVMDFKHRSGQHYCVVLPRRSLLIMSGESRYDWVHGITPKKFDVICTENGYDTIERQTRTSFTFRKIRNCQCTCDYKALCDSAAQKDCEVELQNEVAAKLEEVHVHKIYQEIANHFCDTRHKPWPNVLAFVESFEQGSILLDVGCGNGKYLGCNQSTFNIGCDMCSNLIQICRDRGFEGFVCDSLCIPFKDGSVDGAISIAVIHHMANQDRRLQAIKEIIRALKIDGRALIYVWAKDQMKDGNKTSYMKQDRKNRKEHIQNETNECEELSFSVSNTDVTLPVHTNRTQFKHKDSFVPWKLKSPNTQSDSQKTFYRFYHVFEEAELEGLCMKVEGVEIIKSYYDQGNWCVILKKVNK